MRKINVSFKIEVDVEAYANEYGITIDEAITRIKSHVRDAGTAELIENGFVKQAFCLTKRAPDAANVIPLEEIDKDVYCHLPLNVAE